MYYYMLFIIHARAFDSILLFAETQFTKWSEGDFCVGVFHIREHENI